MTSGQPRIHALLALAGLAAAVGACRPPAPAAIIGLGYRGYQRVTAVAIATDSAAGNPSISIISETDTSGETGPAGEVNVASRLARTPGMAGVVGHGGSREALMTAPIYNEAHIPQIVPTGTSRRLAAAGPWTFTMAPNDSVEGEYLVRFVAERLRARSVMIFYVLDEYGAGLRDGATAALARRGIRAIDAIPVPTVADCVRASDGNLLASAVDAALLTGRPDVVILAARQRESGCIAERVNRKFPGMRFVAGDGLLADGEFKARAGAAGDSTWVVAFWHQDRADSVSRAFVARFRARYHEIPTHNDAMIYDGLLALTAAVHAVGPDGEKVRRYLASLGHERPALAGVTGPIAFPGGADRLLMTRVSGPGLRDLVQFP